MPLAGASPPACDVTVTVSGLRSSEGQVIACLTSNPEAFPNCEKDPEAIGLAVPASDAALIDLGTVPAGRYAIALIHDENSNGRLDKRLMFPREGFGFSRDAKLRMGPPSFRAAAFEADRTRLNQPIRMRYLF